MKLYITTRVDGKFQPVTDADALAELQSRQPAPITDAEITAAAASRSMHTHYAAAQVREQRYQLAASAKLNELDKAAPKRLSWWQFEAPLCAVIAAAGFAAWWWL